MKLIPEDRSDRPDSCSSLTAELENQNEPVYLALVESNRYEVNTETGKSELIERLLCFESEGGFGCNGSELRELLPYLSRFAYGGDLFKSFVRPIERWPHTGRTWKEIPHQGETTQIVDRDMFPEWYLTWCWSNEELQAYWRDEWEDALGHTHSNIWPGDRFSCGTYPQFGLVVEKVLWLESLNGKPNIYHYQLGGDIGGHWRNPHHTHIAEGYFQWIPSIEQLCILGFTEQAERLCQHYKERGEKKA